MQYQNQAKIISYKHFYPANQKQLNNRKLKKLFCKQLYKSAEILFILEKYQSKITFIW